MDDMTVSNDLLAFLEQADVFADTSAQQDVDDTREQDEPPEVGHMPPEQQVDDPGPLLPGIEPETPVGPESFPGEDLPNAPSAKGGFALFGENLFGDAVLPPSAGLIVGADPLSRLDKYSPGWRWEGLFKAAGPQIGLVHSPVDYSKQRTWSPGHR